LLFRQQRSRGQQRIVLPKIHRRHRHIRIGAYVLFLSQQFPKRTHTQHCRTFEQLHQRRLDQALAGLGGQVQNLHVGLVRTRAVLVLQSVVSPPKGRRRIQIRAVHVACKRSRLAHQPNDDVPIIDLMLVLPTQPRHPLHQRVRVPDLDLLDADPRLDVFADQTRRHRVRVITYLDRAATPHTHPPPFLRLQTPGRQLMQHRQFRLQRLRTRRVATLRQLTQELLVCRSTREIPASTQQQRLRDRLLEPSMALLTIAVLMAARRVGRFALDAVVIKQSLIPRRELLRLAVRVDRQRQPIGPMMRRRPAQFPIRVLHPGTQVREILREAHHHVFPVRMGQHEMIQQMIEPLARDGHLQAAHVRFLALLRSMSVFIAALDSDAL